LPRLVGLGLPMAAEFAFIREIESSIASSSPGRRSDILKGVTELFISGAAGFTEEDVSVFDDVFSRLVAEIELSARALLAKKLAPLRNSPPGTIRVLAFDDAIEVAGPVLAQSARLDDLTLVENARQKGQEHMLAISQRGSLSEIVTDVLVEIGDREVVLSTVDNYGARFSDRGFSTLVRRSEGDDLLAECVGLRPEIPSHLLVALIAKASDTVRQKLEAAYPHAREQVRQAVAEATTRTRARALGASLDLTAALAAVASLEQSGRLDDAAVAAFAKAGSYAETVAALAALSDLPPRFVEQLIAQGRSDSVPILARSIGLSWLTVKLVLSLCADRQIIAQSEVMKCLASFERLKTSTAQEIVRFYRLRARSNKAPPA